MIKNLQDFRKHWGDLEVFIPERIKFDDFHKETVYHDCRVFASSAMRDKIIVFVDAEGDRQFEYKR